MLVQSMSLRALSPRLSKSGSLLATNACTLAKLKSAVATMRWCEKCILNAERSPLGGNAKVAEVNQAVLRLLIYENVQQMLDLADNSDHRSPATGWPLNSGKPWLAVRGRLILTPPTGHLVAVLISSLMRPLWDRTSHPELKGEMSENIHVAITYKTIQEDGWKRSLCLI